MKVRNIKTREIGNLVLNINPNRESYSVVSTENGDTICGNLVIADYDSLAELNAEWCDVPEEPKEHWYIDIDGEVLSVPSDDGCEFDNNCREIGNYFSSKEEAEKVVEKLKAFRRLKDKGFKFNKWTIPEEPKTSHIKLVIEAEMDVPDSPYDLDCLFSREVI